MTGVVRAYQSETSEYMMQTLFNYFDANHYWSIDCEEFLHRVRGHMNDACKQLVVRAFQKLDKNGTGAYP